MRRNDLIRDKKLKFFFPVLCFACKIGAVVLVALRMLRTFDRSVLRNWHGYYSCAQAFLARLTIGSPSRLLLLLARYALL